MPPFPSDFPTKILYAFLIRLKHAAGPTHLIPLDLTQTNLGYLLHMDFLPVPTYCMTCI
jgi:hypothetical protein